MALVPLVKIQIQQNPTPDYPTRKNTITLPFVIDCDIELSWACLTDNAKIVFPNNIYYKDQNGNAVGISGGMGGSVQGKPIIASSGTQVPLFLRGDAITITGGFGYLDNQGNAKTIYQQLFQGYISGVKNKIPIEIDCEDNMWLLKQVLVPDQVWADPMEDMIQQMLDLVNAQKGTNFTLGNNPQGITTNLGGFRTQGETVCEVLTRLQKDYKIESFFRGATLYCGTIVYYPNSNPIRTFILEKNILEGHSLEYTRTDDINIALKAYSVNKLELQTATKRGALKTKNTRLEVMVGVVNGKYVALTTSKADQDRQSNSQMRTMYFWDVTSLSDLTQKAINMLHRFYYEGFRGSFTTLGLPYVQHGDQVNVQSMRLPEWNGTYFVKGIKYKLGVSGWHQTIEIDMLSSIFTPAQLAQGI